LIYNTKQAPLVQFHSRFGFRIDRIYELQPSSSFTNLYTYRCCEKDVLSCRPSWKLPIILREAGFHGHPRMHNLRINSIDKWAYFGILRKCWSGDFMVPFSGLL